MAKFRIIAQIEIPDRLLAIANPEGDDAEFIKTCLRDMLDLALEVAVIKVEPVQGSG